MTGYYDRGKESSASVKENELLELLNLQDMIVTKSTGKPKPKTPALCPDAIYVSCDCQNKHQLLKLHSPTSLPNERRLRSLRGTD